MKVFVPFSIYELPVSADSKLLAIYILSKSQKRPFAESARTIGKIYQKSGTGKMRGDGSIRKIASRSLAELVNAGFLEIVGPSGPGIVSEYRVAHGTPGGGETAKKETDISKADKLIAYLRNLPYGEYVKSAHWERVRKRCFASYQYACNDCHGENLRLHAHHVTYENLGNERDEDLVALCEKCHELRHSRGVL